MKDDVKILYVCDHRACKVCSKMCNHTTDINHAENFENVNGIMIEKIKTCVDISEITADEYNAKEAFEKIADHSENIDAPHRKKGDNLIIRSLSIGLYTTLMKRCVMKF